jgi:hypothetical protein
MNMRPRLTAAFHPPAPTDEPTLLTAGSARTISRASRCSLAIASKEMSGEARVPPNTSPVSSAGK